MIADAWIDDELKDKRALFAKHADGIGSKLALTTLSELVDLMIDQKKLKLFASEPVHHSKGVIDGMKVLKGEIDAVLATAK